MNALRSMLAEMSNDPRVQEEIAAGVVIKNEVLGVKVNATVAEIIAQFEQFVDGAERSSDPLMVEKFRPRL